MPPPACPDGVLSADELAAVARAVGTFGGSADAPAESFFDGLLQHAQELASGRKELPGKLDFDAFVRIMTSKAMTEFKAPEHELKPAFSALDANGDGVISREELMAAMESVQENMGKPTFTAQEVEDAFNAADRNESGAIDYEEFVAVSK